MQRRVVTFMVFAVSLVIAFLVGNRLVPVSAQQQAPAYKFAAVPGEKGGQDILGAYFFRVPAISVYWMVIGIMSGVLGVSVEALTIVVATHELAHAYSHLGRDIDGGRWETEAFARADASV